MASFRIIVKHCSLWILFEQYFIDNSKKCTCTHHSGSCWLVDFSKFWNAKKITSVSEMNCDKSQSRTSKSRSRYTYETPLRWRQNVYTGEVEWLLVAWVRLACFVLGDLPRGDMEILAHHTLHIVKREPTALVTNTAKELFSGEKEARKDCLAWISSSTCPDSTRGGTRLRWLSLAIDKSITFEKLPHNLAVLSRASLTKVNSNNQVHYVNNN